MALVVETGTGASDSESYAAIANIAEYASKHGLTFPASPAGPAEAAARRATAWIDGTYRSRFPGERKNGREQALEWPRVNAYDDSGNEIEDDEIPAEIVIATCEAAVRELASPGVLSPDVTPGKIKTEVAVSGAVSVKYATGYGIEGQKPVSTKIDDILATLLGKRVHNALFGKVSRA